MIRWIKRKLSPKRYAKKKWYQLNKDRRIRTRFGYDLYAVAVTANKNGKDYFRATSIAYRGKLSTGELVRVSQNVFPPEDGYTKHKSHAAAIDRQGITRVVRSWR